MGYIINKDNYSTISCVVEEIMTINSYSEDSWEYVENLEDFSDYDNYKKVKRLEDIERELSLVSGEYDTYMKTPVMYSNKHAYLPSYAKDTYQGMIVAERALIDYIKENPDVKLPITTTFPVMIKDSTKLASNAVLMTYSDLIQLSIFLTMAGNTAWQIKADKEDALIKEKTKLLN